MTARQAFTGENIRYTTRGSVLYAIVLAWPGTGEDHDPISPKTIGRSGVLDFSGQKLAQATQSTEGLHIETPVQKSGEYAFTFNIE